MFTKPAKPVVIFVSTVFEHVNTGPAIYARYLWEEFKDHEEIDFHLVAPNLTLRHCNAHSAKFSGSSVADYRTLQELALKIAGTYSDRAIIHSNNAHSVWKFKNYEGPAIAQVNDYDAADSNRQFLLKVKNYGPRRVASLIWRRMNEKSAISFCDRIICNSQFTQKRLVQAYGPKLLAKSDVIYKAVDLDLFSIPNREIFSDRLDLTGEKRVLFLGANWRRKGLDIAIRALDILRRSEPTCSLIVAGKKGQNADDGIAELPKMLGIAERVQFLGPVKREHLPQLFAQSDLLTLPSREEALGVAILEALASGLPVVGSDVGGIPEILGDCQHSILVRPNDPSDLANAFQKLLSSKSKRIDIQRECHAVANRFSKEVMIEKIKNLYLEIEASRI